jgi:RND superfamily putative drug exporter
MAKCIHLPEEMAMFQKIGDVVGRGAPFIVIAWGMLLALLLLLAPPWREVVLDREFAYLPKDSPSQQAETTFKKAFASQYHPSNLGIILYRSDGVLSHEDFDFIKKSVAPGLLRIAQEEGGLADQVGDATNTKSIIGIIRTFDDPGIGALLVSEDKKATLIVLELTTELLQYNNWDTLQKIDDLLARLQREGETPTGLNYAQTGSAAIGRDITQAQARSATATQVWTLAFAGILLLVLYGAPLLALVPLISLLVAVEVALKVLTILASAGFIVIFEGMQVYTAIILYGTGIDYGLFLIARYRDELQNGAEVKPALANAMGRVGVALTASAATVAFSIGMMAFARFGEFHEAGISITVSLLIGWCAALTLMPSLLRLIGRRWAFGSRAAAEARSSSGPSNEAVGVRFISWERLAHALQRRPGTILLGSVVVMAPFAVFAFLHRDNLEYDLLKRPLDDAPSIVGTKVLAAHFPQGIIAPVVVLVRQPGFNFQSDRGQDAIAELTKRLLRRKSELGLADLRSLDRPLGTTDAAQDALTDLTIKQSEAPQKDAGGGDVQQQVFAFYVRDGDLTQLQLVLNANPMGRSSLDLLDHLQSDIRAELPDDIKNAELQVLGLTSSIHDMRAVTESDQTRIELLVVASVFVILLILLRRLVVAIYLIASVLLSFFCTLGITFAFFWALDPTGFSGLDWKVPIFLFTILMAVGADYNIFLMTRIHEEQETLGDVHAVSSALIKTGRIITSCGIIMAGTFASLLTGSLTDLRQLGFALTCGVLLDTFVVRPILVPAFLILWQKVPHRRSNRSQPGWPRATPKSPTVTGTIRGG